MRILSVRRRTQAVNDPSPLAWWHDVVRWWSSKKSRTKAALTAFVTLFVAVGTFVGFLANGLTVWDIFRHNDPQPAAAASPTGHSTAPPVMPLPTCLTCTTGKTFSEQVSPSSIGARTFRNPLAFGGEGQRVNRLQHVQVVCRYQQLDAPASVQPGWWYLVASPPWNRQYYSPTNSYLNGDPSKGPYVTYVDSAIPVC